MLDIDGAHGEVAGAIDLAGFDFLYFRAERGGRGAQFMGGALLELRLRQLEEPIDIALGAFRPEDILRPIAALMPARYDELEEVDDMIGMEVGEEDRVDLGAVAAGSIEAFRRARAAIHEIGAALVADYLRPPEAAGVDLRATGAEKCQEQAARYRKPGGKTSMARRENRPDRGAA